MSETLPDFVDGAVRPPTHVELERHLEDLERVYPIVAVHRKGLRELGSEIVYARALGEWQPVGAGAWAALVRFGLKMETMFGLTREVLLLYTPHRDLQIRTFHALPQIIEDLPREVTLGLALVCSPDSRAAEKLDDWSTGRFLGVPVPADESDLREPGRQLLKMLQERIFTRDLYAETAPVSGSDFYGRRILLQSLVHDVEDGRVFGVFGLRKSGKTSILKRVGEELRASGQESSYAFVLRDLESLPSLPREVVRPLVADLRDDILSELRRLNLRTREIAEMNDPADMLEFKRALQAVLKKEGRSGLKLVVALDEVEYLCPPEALAEISLEAQEIPQFFGVLRSLAQENDSFTFAVAGLASSAVEAGMLFGRHNPLFSWAKRYYVPPFTHEESTQILRSLGSRMGVGWEDAAIDLVNTHSGGHAYLLRDFASSVVRRLPLSPSQRVVTRSEVNRAALSWRRRIAANLAEIVSHLDRYYPTERVLVDVLLEDVAAFPEIAADEPQALEHLLQLGLITETAPNAFAASSLLEQARA